MGGSCCSTIKRTPKHPSTSRERATLVWRSRRRGMGVRMGKRKKSWGEVVRQMACLLNSPPWLAIMKKAGTAGLRGGTRPEETGRGGEGVNKVGGGRREKVRRGPQGMVTIPTLTGNCSASSGLPSPSPLTASARPRSPILATWLHSDAGLRVSRRGWVSVCTLVLAPRPDHAEPLATLACLEKGLFYFAACPVY